MKKKILILCLLPLFILCISQCDQKNIEAYYEADNQRDIESVYKEEKIYSNATVEDNFAGDSVLVVLDRKTGGINKTHKKVFLALLMRNTSQI